MYRAEVTQVFKDECHLKYMKKSGGVYTWPEQPDMSQELTDSIVSTVGNSAETINRLTVCGYKVPINRMQNH